MSKKGKSSLQEAQEQKFGQMLSQCFKEWKSKEQHRSQRSLAKLLDPPVPQGQISKWLNGYSLPPDDYLDEIKAIFAKDDIELKINFMLNENDRYTFDSEYMSKWIEDHYAAYFHKSNKKYFGRNRLDSFHAFLVFLKSLEIDDEFPLWTPIVPVKNTKLHNSYYIRAPYNTLPNSAPSDYPEFQINKGDDGIKLLQEQDIDFLVSVYNELIKFIEQLYWKQHSDLEQGARNAEIVALIKGFKNNNRKYDPNDVLSYQPAEDDCKELTEEEMALIDGYYAAIYRENFFQEISKAEKEDEK